MSEETPPDIPVIWAQLCHKDRRIRESALLEAKRLSEREVVLLYRYAVCQKGDEKKPPDLRWEMLFAFVGSTASIAFLTHSIWLGLILGILFFAFYFYVRIDSFVNKTLAATPALMRFVEIIPSYPETPEILEVLLSPSLPLILRHTGVVGMDEETYYGFSRCYTVLKEALPLLNQEVADRIRKPSLKPLYALLEKPYQDTELTLRILHAIPYFADEAALPYITPLMDEGKATQNMQRISYAAQLCYRQLQAAIAERKESGLLLRPSSGNADEAQALLRPSEENPEDKRDLLRPQL